MTTSELTIYQPGSKEAHDCMRRHNVLYGCDGQPMASVYWVFPHLLMFDHPHFIKKKVERGPKQRMRNLAKKLGAAMADKDSDVYYQVFKPYEDFILELDDEEICAVLNEACDTVDDFVGYDYAVEIFKALQRLDDKFGSFVCNPWYTYNDPDSYCGQHDIQFTIPSKSGDPWTPTMFDVLFLQIHPGGDARNMASGRFYTPEGLDETTNLYDTLGAYGPDLGTTVEVPVEFPLEQWIKQKDKDAWDSIYREDKKGSDDRWFKTELLEFHDFDVKPGYCRTYFAPNCDNGAGVDVYRCYDIAAYSGDDLWTWVPLGELVGESRSSVGISATPHIRSIAEYSTAGYFEWTGPEPGTDEWKELFEKRGLTEITVRRDGDKKDQTKNAFKEE